LTSPAPYPIIEDRKIYWRTTMEKELVVVIDFGGQYNQLVARRVRECNVYCEIYSYRTDLNKIKAMNPKGIILTGGPASCYEPGAATCSEDLFHRLLRIEHFHVIRNVLTTGHICDRCIRIKLYVQQIPHCFCFIQLCKNQLKLCDLSVTVCDLLEIPVFCGST